jgi:hypothetical protein
VSQFYYMLFKAASAAVEGKDAREARLAREAANRKRRWLKISCAGLVVGAVFWVGERLQEVKKTKIAQAAAEKEAADAPRRAAAQLAAETKRKDDAKKLDEHLARMRAQREANRTYDSDRRSADGCKWRTMPSGAKIPFDCN